jgi:hypothetical protein
MPKPILFAPCERVLINKDDNNISLITVLQGVTVNVPGPSKIPLGGLTRWQVLTLWIREPSDEGKRFEQSVELLLPDGNSYPQKGVQPTQFSMDKRILRHTFTVHGFPVPKSPGECLLKLWLRDVSENGDWQQVAEYPLALNLKNPPVTGDMERRSPSNSN